MGTCSYVLTGTEQGMKETFGSTCHGAVSIQNHSPFVKLCYTVNIDYKLCPGSSLV